MIVFPPEPERAVAETKVTLLAVSMQVLIESLKTEGVYDQVDSNFRNMLDLEARKQLARGRFRGAVTKIINAQGYDCAIDCHVGVAGAHVHCRRQTVTSTPC